MVNRLAADFKNVLLMGGDIEWGRYLGSYATEEQAHIPPLIVWRYGKEDLRRDNLIRRVVWEFRGEVDWRLTEGKNWVLCPRKVEDVIFERGLSSDSEAIGLIAKETPAFGLQANRDLEALSALLKEALQEAGYSRKCPRA